VIQDSSGAQRSSKVKQPNKKKGLKMDTSSSQMLRPVDFVHGTKYSHDQLTHDDWLRTLNTVLKDIGPQLKYLSAMQIPFDALKWEFRTAKSFLTHGQCNRLHTDLTSSGKCMTVCSFSSDPRIKEQIQRPPEGSHYDFILVMTIRSTFFVVFTTYRVKQPLSSFSKVIYVTKAIEAFPVALEELDLTGLVNSSNVRDGCIATKIIDSLHSAFTTTINIKQRHIEGLLETRREIRQKMAFFDVFTIQLLRDDAEP
jgi:hypothetical protein